LFLEFQNASLFYVLDQTFEIVAARWWQNGHVLFVELGNLGQGHDDVK